MSKVNVQKQKKENTASYQRLDRLNGKHPYMKQVPDGCVEYKVRTLPTGKVAYFNYKLAKEMGLIKASHPEEMNKQLEKALLNTFNIRIINEYDIEKKISFDENTIKPNTYMATRYLQLQHPNKQGKTSGDGRGIWNGTVRHKGKTWDVSSRGTGVTQLAPGFVKADKTLQSGNTEFGYGCGLAEIDELVSASLLAEIFHNNDINTERVLAIIDSGDGYGIGVRAGQNLFRPAHLFLFLKQNNIPALKQATDFLIQRQFENNEWDFNTDTPKCYDLFLDEICHSFAKFAALLEREYIFTWLDWDGDNVLANAGIIDYGSIRQFGLRHDQYRYDDVERYSTNLNEQRSKSKNIVQVFSQLVDALKNGEKNTLKNFKDHKILQKFDKAYEYYLLDHFLYQVGYNKDFRKNLLLKKREHIQNFYNTFLSLEKQKTKKKIQRVGDGINRPAIFNMRRFLCEYPKLLVNNGFKPINLDDIFELILSEFATKSESKLYDSLKVRINNLQEHYINTVKICGTTDSTLASLDQRASKLNVADRVTGNALILIVDELLESYKNNLSQNELQSIIEHFIASQSLNIPVDSSTSYKGTKKGQALMRTMLTLVEGHKEDI